MFSTVEYKLTLMTEFDEKYGIYEGKSRFVFLNCEK